MASMIQGTSRHRDFPARSLMDFAKAMFAVGLVSYFFKGFTIALRIGCAVGFFGLFAGALLLYPSQKPEG